MKRYGIVASLFLSLTAAVQATSIATPMWLTCNVTWPGPILLYVDPSKSTRPKITLTNVYGAYTKCMTNTGTDSTPIYKQNLVYFDNKYYGMSLANPHPGDSKNPASSKTPEIVLVTVQERQQLTDMNCVLPDQVPDVVKLTFDSSYQTLTYDYYWRPWGDDLVHGTVPWAGPTPYACTQIQGKTMEQTTTNSAQPSPTQSASR